MKGDGEMGREKRKDEEGIEEEGRWKGRRREKKGVGGHERMRGGRGGVRGVQGKVEGRERGYEEEKMGGR